MAGHKLLLLCYKILSRDKERDSGDGDAENTGK